MKILWITNILMPDIAEAMGLTKPSTGGWMPSMASFLMKQDKDLQLTIATVYKCNEPICRQINGINYYVLPLKDKMTVYQKHLENLWKKVYEKLRPDVVHIHGTEYPHGLAFLRAYPDAKAVVSMQGMIGPYSKFYLAGLTNYDIYSHLTLLDLLTCSNISINKKNFGRREQYETEIIKRVRHVIGRTSWDRAQTWAINPKVEYHFCNETLRETFYHHTWNYENCEPHSIFVSQAGYPLKGFHQLLKAMPLILREYPDAKIYVSGPNVIDVKVLFKRWHLRSNYGSYLKSLIRKLHIENKVVFLGMLQEEAMCEHYLKSNVFVCPSSIENSPNSLGEAQLLGMPCVASYVGGIPDMMKGQEEWCYRFEDIEMLAQLVCKAFEIKQPFSRAIAQERHDSRLNAYQMLKIYSEIIQNKSE